MHGKRVRIGTPVIGSFRVWNASTKIVRRLYPKGKSAIAVFVLGYRLDLLHDVLQSGRLGHLTLRFDREQRRVLSSLASASAAATG